MKAKNFSVIICISKRFEISSTFRQVCDLFSPLQDWEYLLGSSYHHQQRDQFLPGGTGSHLSLKVKEQGARFSQEEERAVIDSTAKLFPHIPSVAFVLHLVYEVIANDNTSNRNLMKQKEKNWLGW